MLPCAYVIERKIREDWAAGAPEDFAKSELDWQIVSGGTVPMAYLSVFQAITDMPNNDDPWWEYRVRNIVYNRVEASHKGQPYKLQA